MTSNFKLYILSIMQDRRDGFIALLLKCFLRFLSWIYGFAVRIVDWCYISGIRRVHKASVPVVSVGNITLGGTGKTPFAVFLALYLERKGKKPSVLTRGYGSDERRMLVDELPDIPVFVGQDRVKSAKAAANDGRDVLVLDDGFQHKRIARDLDILMLDSESLFGNGALFPRGVLREPIPTIKRADILVLSKIDKIDEAKKKELMHELGSIAPEKLIVTSRHKPVCFNDVTGAAYPVDYFKDEKILVFSGIADPGYLAASLKTLGADVALELNFADHHTYTQRDIGTIYKAVLDRKIEKIVTTKKDYVKLQHLDTSYFEEKLFILDIEIEIVDNREAFFARLDSVISG
jgi:tetraacyldisaccharide 4'-kinase